MRSWESTLGGDAPLWTSTPTSTETSTSLLRTLWRRVEVARPELSSRAVKAGAAEVPDKSGTVP